MRSGELRHRATILCRDGAGDGIGGQSGRWVVAGERHVSLPATTWKDRLESGIMLADDVVRIVARYDPIWEPLRRVQVNGQTYRIDTVDVDNRTRQMTIGARREQ